MQQPLLKVALAGATGNLGRPILTALLSTNTIHVTVLTRSSSSSPNPTLHDLPTSHPNLTITPVSFTDVPTLTQTLKSNDIRIVISALATSAIAHQNPLIAASAAAGSVSRFIPAEFGMDSTNPFCMALPVCVPKVETQAYLNQKVREYPGFSWTGIANGLFLDWGLAESGFIADVKGRRVTLYNGGDVPFSVTRLEGVARAVLGVIWDVVGEDRGMGTRNRLVRVHEAVVTQNMLVRMVKGIDGREWTVVEKETEVLRGECFGLLDRGRVEEAMLGFCAVASWDERYGGNFEGRVDNELLGVGMLGEDGVREVVRRAME